MVYIDELREIGLEAWESVQPFLKTTQGQLWATSNAGDITSEALNELRSSIIAYPDERRAIYEWSAPEKAPITDRAGWAMANPSLGWLFEETAIEDSLATMSQGGFRTETLCQFVTALNPAIPMEEYEECAGTPTVEPSSAQCWFAVDATPDSKRADLVVTIEGERTILAPLRSWTHDGAVDDQKIADEIAALALKWRPRLIGYNAYAAPGIGSRLTLLGHPTKNITGVEFAQACDQLLSAVVHKRLIHPNDPTMTQHFAHSVAKPTADGGWRLYRRESGGYISLACASAMAISLASVPRTSPMVMAV
jgi:phage terminase large subunit-like protein